MPAFSMVRQNVPLMLKISIGQSKISFSQGDMATPESNERMFFSKTRERCAQKAVIADPE
jgi:hypothetical protein